MKSFTINAECVREGETDRQTDRERERIELV